VSFCRDYHWFETGEGVRMAKEYDVIIVGAGSFGMSAAYYLTKQGASVLLLDAGNPPHDQGSHHGYTRIFRMAYTMGSDYVELAMRSKQLWERLEQDARSVLGGSENAEDAGRSIIFRKTGVISIGEANSAFLSTKEASCRQFKLPYERLSALQLSTRWPGLAIPSGKEGLYEPEGGILFSENALRAYKELALQAGATLFVHTPVQRLQYDSHRVTVHTLQGAYCGKHVLLSTGAWLPQLVPELKLPIKTVRKAIGWYHAPADRYDAKVFPAFIFNEGGSVEYYGIPAVNGHGLKIGKHDQGQVISPDTALEPFGTYEEDKGDLDVFLRNYMPRTGAIQQGGICKYEMTPDEGLLIGRHPHHPQVWLAGGGSGHGFKFASAIGEGLSELILFGRSERSLDAFQINKDKDI
jgi:monomeric sarcosine oxidase